MKSNDTTMSGIRMRGHKALFDALGPVGFVRFMQQFVARGDYTKEREKWIDKVDLSDLKARLNETSGQRKRRVM
jgi:hypothetical protein